MLQKTWQNKISTPIPQSLSDPSHIVSILHDHGFLITMSPIVTRYSVASTEDTNPSHPGDEKINYDVWEIIGLGPMKKEICFQCSFENRDDGVVSWIQAPMGLVSKATYSVRFRAGEDEGWVLHEEIESTCNTFLKGFVEKTMVQTRKEMHGRIVEKAKENEREKEVEHGKAKSQDEQQQQQPE